MNPITTAELFPITISLMGRYLVTRHLSAEQDRNDPAFSGNAGPVGFDHEAAFVDRTLAGYGVVNLP